MHEELASDFVPASQLTESPVARPAIEQEGELLRKTTPRQPNTLLASAASGANGNGGLHATQSDFSAHGYGWLSNTNDSQQNDFPLSQSPCQTEIYKSISPMKLKWARSRCVPRMVNVFVHYRCLLYTSPSPRDQRGSRMPSSA